MLKTRIAVLVSGGGTNLQALLDAEYRDADGTAYARDAKKAAADAARLPVARAELETLLERWMALSELAQARP